MSLHSIDVSMGPLAPLSGSRVNHHTAAPLPQHQMQSRTPPASTSGSPQIKIEGLCSDASPEQYTLPGLLHHLNSPREAAQVRLPSLGEFDQGVEALVRTHGPVSTWSPPSPLPLTSRSHPLPSIKPMSLSRPTWPLGSRASEDSMNNDFHAPRRGTITSLSQYALDPEQSRQTYLGYAKPEYQSYSPQLQSQVAMDCYPSPPPEGENRHINQKYTTEEGDFIIYAWHDKKMKWQRIKQEFASRFGRTPERTVQGLQAWYYRMNQRIPVWDHEGWLIFDNEDDLEPRQIGIKCRERDSQDKPMEPLGLAQRYPERAINYAWVDHDLKMKSRDWAAKRALQYRERRERRKRKEQRRMKL